MVQQWAVVDLPFLTRCNIRHLEGEIAGTVQPQRAGNRWYKIEMFKNVRKLFGQVIGLIHGPLKAVFGARVTVCAPE